MPNREDYSVPDEVMNQGDDALWQSEPNGQNPPAQQSQPDNQMADNQQSAAPAQQQPEAHWIAEQWPIKYKGQTHFPKDRDHQIALMQKRFSYETDQEHLNRRAREMDDLKRSYDPYMPFIKFAEENPAFMSMADKLYNDYQTGALQPAQGSESGINLANLPEFRETRKELEDLKRFKQESVLREEQQRIDKELGELQTKYPTFDWKSDDGSGTLSTKIMKAALESEVYDFDKVFKYLMFDEVQSRSRLSGKKDAVTAQQNANRAGIVRTGTPAIAGQGKAFDPTKMSYSELTTMAMNDF